MNDPVEAEAEAKPDTVTERWPSYDANVDEEWDELIPRERLAASRSPNISSPATSEAVSINLSSTSPVIVVTLAFLAKYKSLTLLVIHLLRIYYPTLTSIDAVPTWE